MSSEIEVKLANLEAEVSRLRTRIENGENIEAIERLQHSYGYYFERGMNAEVADLFSTADDAAIHFRGIGGFLGANAKKSWDMHLPGMDGPTYLHLLAFTSGMIDVAKDGTASGRWYGWGLVATPADEVAPGAINHFAFGAVYENRYVKEGGVWKIKVIDMALLVKFKNPGFVDPDKFDVVYIDPTADAKGRDDSATMFDFRDHTPTLYPSPYMLPFHFRHPVTGAVTSDLERNRAAGFVDTGAPRG